MRNIVGSWIWRKSCEDYQVLRRNAAGGIFALATLYHGYYGLVAPVCLLFYGLALINACQNLFDEMRYLGYCEVILGIVSAIFIGYGLLFWAIGFGVLHIVYGVLMYRKYDA